MSANLILHDCVLRHMNRHANERMSVLHARISWIIPDVEPEARP